MKALVYTGTQELVYREEKNPSEVNGESILKVHASGICGSDMHAYHGKDDRRIPPLILGHEVSGKIQNGNFTASKKNKVNNVNLVIKEQGEIISLLGPSGIGKTTILRTLAGLQKLSSGKILLKDKNTGVRLYLEELLPGLSIPTNSLFISSDITLIV